MGTALLRSWATPAPASKMHAPGHQGGAQPRGTAGPGAPTLRHWKEQREQVGELVLKPRAGAARTAGAGQTSVAAGGSAGPSTGALSCS